MRTGRRIAALAALLALTLLLPLEAGAQANPRYWLQVVGDDGTVITSGYCRPLNAGLMTEPTIYSNSTLATVKSIPITINATTGECDWYQTRGRTYDVMVYVTAGNYKGAAVRMDGFTGVGKAVVGRAHGTKVVVIPFTATASATPTTASETLHPGFLIRDVIVETKTAVAGSSIFVGLATPVPYANALLCGPNTAGDANFWSNPVLTASVGFQDCNPSQRLTMHTSGSLGITYSKQSHASAGYIYIYGRSVGNVP